MSGDTLKVQEYKWEIVWKKTLVLGYMHAAALYGLFLLLAGRCKFYTVLFDYWFAIFSGIGITAGAHRLWAHKAYKATWQLRLILALLHTMSFQSYLYEWVRDHRSHHKFTDTDADPYNAKRGFFFSHVGWLLIKKHPDVKSKGKTVDMSDLEADPIVMWQKKLHWFVIPFFCFFVPTVIPVYFWNEDPWISWHCRLLGLFFSLNSTFLVNSAAHIWGMKPYDKTMTPAENRLVGILAFGEGWHNYHHVFPYDYKAAELGNYSVNITTALIDFMAKIGWAYDLRTVPLKTIQSRAERTGDGSLKDPDDPKHHMNNVWTWEDKDISQEKKENLKEHPKVN